jgi:hypothetical protein
MSRATRTNNDYSDLERKVEQLRLRRLNNLTGREPSSIPYKAKVKRAASAHPFARKDNQELARHPGGRGLAGVIKMISATETGCRLATAPEELRILNSTTNANTTTFESGR